MALTFTTGNTFSAGDTVTATKLNNVVNSLTTSMATSKVLGRTTASAGPIEELAITGSGSVVLGTQPTLDRPNIANVVFPAVQSASADANTLDDYEEGNWTPSLGGTATYTAQVGRYTKIGRMVYITGVIQVNAIGTGSTYSISGLPFTASSDFYEWPGSVAAWTSAAGNFVFVGFRVMGGTTTGEMTCAAGAQNSCNTSTAVFTSGTYVYFSAAYSV